MLERIKIVHESYLATTPNLSALPGGRQPGGRFLAATRLMLVATNYGARGVDNVDLSTSIGQTLVDNVDNLVLGASVDNVDNLFLSCPTCPQKTKVFWEKEKGRVKKQVKVWTMWTL